MTTQYDQNKLAVARMWNSNDAIASALSQQEGFDMQEHLERGYSHSEIVDHLALGGELKPKVSLGAEVARGLGRGLVDVVQLGPELVDFGLHMAGADVARESLTTPVLQAMDRFKESEALRPSLAAEAEGITARKLVSGVSQALPTLASMFVPVGLAGKAVQASKAVGALDKGVKATKAGKFIGGVPGAVGVGSGMLMEGNFAHGEFRKFAEENPDDPNVNAMNDFVATVGTGAFAGGLEALSGMTFFNKLFGKAGGKVAGNIWKRIAHEVPQGMLMEGGTEAIQEVIANGFAKLGYDPSRELTEGAFESFLIGGLLGGGVGGVSAALQKPNEHVPAVDIEGYDVGREAKKPGASLAEVIKAAQEGTGSFDEAREIGLGLDQGTDLAKSIMARVDQAEERQAPGQSSSGVFADTGVGGDVPDFAASVPEVIEADPFAEKRDGARPVTDEMMLEELAGQREESIEENRAGLQERLTGPPESAEDIARRIAERPETELEKQLANRERLAATRQTRQKDLEVAFSDMTPEELRPGFQKIREQIESGEAGGQQVRNDEGELVGFLGSSYPEWYRFKTKEKLKKLGRDWNWTKKDVFSVLDKVREGKELTGRQQERFETLVKIAKEDKDVSYEANQAEKYDDLLDRGFEPLEKDVLAGDLKPGDKVVIKEGLIDDEYEHKGYDRDGNVILKDGITKHVDPFEAVRVEGIKRGDTEVYDDNVVAGILEAIKTNKDIEATAKEVEAFADNPKMVPHLETLRGAVAKRRAFEKELADGIKGESGSNKKTKKPEVKYDTVEEGGVRYGLPHRAALPDDNRQTGEPSDVSDGAPKQLTLFSPQGDVPGRTRTQKKFLEAYPAKIGSFRFDTDTVSSAQDAAHVLSPLTMRAQETALVLALDSNKKPIAVLQHSVGGPRFNNVFLPQLVGSLHNLKGIDSFWFAHNHPSSNLSKSPEDAKLTMAIQNAVKDTGVSFNGHIIVTPAGKAVELDRRGKHKGAAFSLRQKQGKGLRSVKVLERRLAGDEPELLGPVISSSADMRQFFADKAKGLSGILLLDTQHRPVQFVAATRDEMVKMRAGGISGLAAKLYRILDRKNNAGSVALHFGRESAKNKVAIENVTAFTNAIGINLLDVFVGGRSLADAGEVSQFKEEAGTAFFSRSEIDNPFSSRDTKEKEDDNGKITKRAEYLRRRLARYYGREIPKGTIAEVQLPDDHTADARRGSPEEIGTGTRTGTSDNPNRRDGGQVLSGSAAIARKVGRIFKKEIVFFKDTHGAGIDGAHFIGKNIFVNIDSSHPHLFITGHELLHTLKKERPDLYAPLRAVAEEEMRLSAFKDFQERLSAKTDAEGRGPASDSLVYEEMLGNYFGTQMFEKTFWEKVAGHETSLFKKLVRYIEKFIRLLKGKMSFAGLQNSEYFHDLVRVQDVLAKAAADYGKGLHRLELKNTPTFYRQAFAEDLASVAAGVHEKVKAGGTFIEGKKDINLFDLVLSSIEHYADKVPVIKRYNDIILSRVDRKFKLETEMLQATGEDALRILEGLSKKNRKQYDNLAGYLVEKDRNQDGFRMERNDGTWSVFHPENKEALFDGLSEEEAVAEMVKAEGEYVRSKGFSNEAVDALITFRAVMNKGFDKLVEQLRAMEKEAAENNQEVPSIEVAAAEKRWAIYKDNPELAVEIFRSKKEAQLFMSELEKDDLKRMQYRLNKFYQAGNSVKLIERTAEQMASDPKTEFITLSEAIAEMGDLRGCYFPRQRESGELILTAVKDGENPILKKFDLGIAAMEGDTPNMANVKKAFNAFTPLGAEIRKLEKQGFSITVKKDESVAEDLFDVVKLVSSVEGVLQKAAQKAGAGENQIVNEVNRILVNSVADIFKGRGYLSARIRRNAKEGSEVYTGYEEDPLKAMTKYVKSLAGGMAKRDVAKEATLVLLGKDISWGMYKKENKDAEYEEYLKLVEKRKLDPGKQKMGYHAVMTHYRENMRNEERVDRIIGTVKGLAVLKFLGFRVSSAAVNLTNLAMAVPATMKGIGKIPYQKTWGYIGGAAISYGKFLNGGGSKEDRAVFELIKANGWDEAQFNMDAAKVLESRLGGGWNWLMNKAMLMFGATEKVNRATTIFAAYKSLVEERGMDTKDALTLAKEISDKAHGVYGKVTLPHMAMGKGPGQMALRLAYVFQKFSHNYLLTMKRLGWDEGEWGSFAHMLLAPAVLAGAGASALTPIIAGISKALGGGDDPEEELYTWANDAFGGGEWMRHGILGLGGRGVNLKGSLQINYAIPTTMAEFLGAPASVLTDEWRGLQEISKGNVQKGLEKMAPSGVAAPFRAIREYREGVTTHGNAPIFFGDEPIKGTGLDAVIRFFAFNPSRLSSMREQQWSDTKVEAKYAGIKRGIYGDIRKFYMQEPERRDVGDWGEILAEIYEYNERVVASGRPGLSRITGRSIGQMLRRGFRASKRERLRVVNG